MNTSSQPFVLRGWHVLASLLAFFGAVIAVNVAFAIAAVRTFPGEDEPHSYVQGLHYNHTLSERHAQAALGWQATARLLSTDRGAAIEVTLATRDGAPVDAALEGELERPTDARLDHSLAFERLGAGLYRAEIGPLPPGDWRLRAHAEASDHEALDFVSELTWVTPR